MRHHHHKTVERNTWASIWTNLALFALKLWAGLVSQSVTLIADAWHTLSDSVSSLIVLLGIRISKKPADEEHPYGHGRAEMIAAILVGTLLAFVAFHFLVESISKLIEHESASYGQVALWVTVVSIVVKEVLARVSIRIGKKAGSRALVADGWHHRSDAFSSAIVLLGIFVSPYWWFIDGLMGILISLFIGYVAYEILAETINALLGRSHDEKTVKLVQRLCNEVAQRDVQAHHLQIHEYGDHKEVVFHIRLPGNWSLQEVHDLVDQLEEVIENRLGGDVNIHVDPIGTL
mgnify:CR=1 FL=1